MRMNIYVKFSLFYRFNSNFTNYNIYSRSRNVENNESIPSHAVTVPKDTFDRFPALCSRFGQLCLISLQIV